MNTQLQIPITENYLLRETSFEDAEETFALVDKNRDYLRQWMPWLDSVHSADDIRRYLEGQINDPNTTLELALIYHGKIIGRLGFHSIDAANRSTSIGYWLDEDHQGQGFMTMAVKAVLDYAFNTLNINRIVIRAAVDNSGSRAIPDRLGFQHEGTAREAEWLYDHFVDLAIYSMLKADWNGITAPISH